MNYFYIAGMAACGVVFALLSIMLLVAIVLSIARAMEAKRVERMSPKERVSYWAMKMSEELRRRGK
jgi:hypothetical protein